MNSLHIALLITSSGCLAAAAAGGAWLRARVAEPRMVQTMGVVIGLALVIGNGACLLPMTPPWYSIAVLGATAAGVVWLLVTVAGARRAGARAASPRLRVIRGDVGLARPAGPQGSRQEAGSGPVATQETIDGAGPDGAPSIRSHTVYVAANLGAYLPDERARRRRGVLGPQRRACPDEIIRRRQVARVYAQANEKTRTTRSTMA